MRNFKRFSLGLARSQYPMTVNRVTGQRSVVIDCNWLAGGVKSARVIPLTVDSHKGLP